ncbi:serine/threonine-protein kinase [Streptomyces anandii]|uniref:serine/threonine-protein kinase n=1 Tax=Streptomyces anandii TaxID=285454 RepID=UPI001677C7F2|nr:serine/threonine-protein kinase [Streptomyces anandii]
MGTEGDDFRVIAGRYRLEARLGRGGMGVVWRATDQLLGRRVAVKELPLDDTLSAEEARLQRDRTLREARAVAQLRHPHIIVVHDVVEDDERPYIVMELIDGGSLADRIAANGPVDVAEAARIGVALLSALRTAHAAGVLHRDIKPANVLMESGTDRVVLTDFGIAQVAGATTLTETGSFVGSPEYTAPERMSGTRTGPESDLWSLGALLCTALSGASPFRRDSLGGILHAVVVDEIRPPAQAGPVLPVVRGLLERDPERRLAAAEAERMLGAFLESGRTPQPAARYTQTQRDVPRPAAPAVATSQAAPAGPDPGAPARTSTRGVLVAALLVAAMAGAGVSAAALLMQGDDNGGRTPVSSAPGTSGHGPGGTTASRPASSPGPRSPSPASSSSPSSSSSSGAASPASSSSGAGRNAPSGYHLVRDPGGFSVAVPDGFTRRPQGERIFYMSPGETFRLGIKIADPAAGGPLGVMRRADAAGPDTNPGYHDGRVTAATHDGHPAALWEFSWNGFSTAEGPRHTYDLCWDQDGRMYDVWVSAPVGKVREAKEYFDVALDTFAAA